MYLKLNWMIAIFSVKKLGVREAAEQGITRQVSGKWTRSGKRQLFFIPCHVDNPAIQSPIAYAVKYLHICSAIRGLSGLPSSRVHQQSPHLRAAQTSPWFLPFMLAKATVGWNCHQNFPWLAGERGKVQRGQEFGPRVAGLDSHPFLSVV